MQGILEPLRGRNSPGLGAIADVLPHGTGLGLRRCCANCSSDRARSGPDCCGKNPYYKEFYKPGGKHPLVNWMVIEVVVSFSAG